MRYKQGIIKDTLQDPQRFKVFAKSILPNKKEQIQHFLGMNEVRYYADFFDVTKRILFSSQMVLCLNQGPGENSREVINPEGESQGLFDFRHIELRVVMGQEIFYFK